MESHPIIAAASDVRSTLKAVADANPTFMSTEEKATALVELIRAEALIRIECGPPLPNGLLALGQRSEQDLDARHGSELLMFLGCSLAAMLRRWLIDPQQS